MSRYQKILSNSTSKRLVPAIELRFLDFPISFAGNLLLGNFSTQCLYYKP